MHHQYRLFEQLVAQHSAGGGPFRQLFKLNAPRVPVGRDQLGAQLFDLRRGSDVYFCVNPLREVADPSTGEPAFQHGVRKRLLQTPQELKRYVLGHMRSLQRTPALLRGFFKKPSLRYITA